MLPALEGRLDLDRKSSRTPLPSATITTFFDEPLFLTGYLGEEDEERELDMSMDSYSDTISLYDDAIIATDDFHATFPELLAEECGFVEHQCASATLVQIVSAGRPTMVDLLKDCRQSTFKASQIVMKRPATSPIRASYIRPSRKSVSSVKSYTTAASSEDQSATDSTPTTPTLENDLEELNTPTSEQSPITPKSSFDKDLKSPKEGEKKDLGPAIMTPTGLSSRVRNSSRLRLFTRRTSSSSTVETVKTLPNVTVQAPSVYMPSRPRAKMVARGASEREPLVQLPPSPVYEEHGMGRPVAVHPTRRDSLAPPQTSAMPKRQRIRRMESIVGLNGR